MKVNAISAYSATSIKRNGIDRRITNVGQNEMVKSSKTTWVSFAGNPDKHPEQIINLATEKKSLGGIYVAGGLGSVADSVPPAVITNGQQYTIGNKKPDMRDCYPYYTYNPDPVNLKNEGKIYVIGKDGLEKAAKGEQLDIKNDFRLVEQNYNLKDGEKFSVITEYKNGNLRYFTLKDTGISGTVERVKRDAFEMEQIPYRMFEVELSEAERMAHPEKTYLIHTPEIARGGKAYGWCDLYRNEKTPGETAKMPTSSTAYANSKPGEVGKLIGRNSDDLFTTEFTRAFEDALPKMNSAAHGNFNPQNIGINDRFPAVILTDMAKKALAGEKYWQGIRYSVFWHNIGRFYQGAYANPVDFFKIIATGEDLEKLKANPNFNKVEEISNKIAKGIATEEESQQIYNFFKPYFQKFVDSEGTFNLTGVTAAAAKEYPDNVVPGNVSRNFGKETRDMNTEDIAKGLTQMLKDIESTTVDIVNGESVAVMDTSNPKGFFGRGKLHQIFADAANSRHYIPYSKTDSADVIYNAKLSNKRNLIDLIAEATEKLKDDPDAIAKLFSSENDIAALRRAGEKEKFTLGGLSKYAEGDILMISWGRPDPQKGYAVALDGFKRFLQDDSIPLETRKRCKFILGGGSGGDFYRTGSNEWRLIQNSVKEIEEIAINGEKGVFKGNTLYINGMVPNRLANCADLGLFTSRFEPCGITPLECYAAGTPVASVKTGGAADFVSPKTGFLTKEPYMLSRKALGLDSTASAEALETARLEHTAKNVAEMLKNYVEPMNDGTFVEKQKEFIRNTLDQKIGWNENLAYNNGKSALNKHMTERWRCQDNNVATELKNSLFGEFDNKAFDKKPKTNDISSGNTTGWWSRLSKGGKTGVIACCIAVGAIAVYGISKAANNKVKMQQQPPVYEAYDNDLEEDDI